MKHYLELIPISAKVHKKQSKMTRICIILAVFLVTAIFSMADMEIRSQYLQTIQSDGNWHAMFKSLSQEQADMIKGQREVVAASWYDVRNYRLDQDYEINGIKVAICGYEEDFVQLMSLAEVIEGRYFEQPQEAVLTANAGKRLDLHIGDVVDITLPNGEKFSLTISGFSNNSGMIMKDDSVGVFVSVDTFRELCKTAGEPDFDRDMAYYVQFSRNCNIPKVITRIENQLGLTKEQVGRNEKLLGVMGMSRDSYIMQLYGAAVVLAVLVITAGILMIAGNLNSNVVRRTEFFGMMRCQGATKSQVKQFVRLEALNWCKSAIPLGLLGGTIITWVLCNMLRLLSPGYFASMPVFGISIMGLVSGAGIGVITVLLAASAPAKRAASVSPLAAVSGNSYQMGILRDSHKKSKRKNNSEKSNRHAIGTKTLHIETVLGMHHAGGSKKNFLLMTGSFAFSIILFLSFTTAVDFLHHALKPLQPCTPDLSVISQDNTCSIAPDLLSQIEDVNGVKRAYGRMFAYHLPTQVNGNDMQINLISYEENQFKWAEDDLTDGKLEDVINGSAVLTVYDMNNPLRVSDTLQTQIKGEEHILQIAGVLSDCPFSREEGVETVICSEQTFRQLTGEGGYTILDIQLTQKATDTDVDKIRELSGTGITFSDQRLSNADVRGAYYSMSLFIYGFLVIIALISIFNIVNSIAMSVSARLQQYGAMRAIGMSDRQVIKMVTAEALTYAVSGIGFGCVIGIPINRLLYKGMITFHWGDVWSLPVGAMLIIVIVVAMASVLAILGPARQIRELTIVDTIRGE